MGPFSVESFVFSFGSGHQFPSQGKVPLSIFSPWVSGHEAVEATALFSEESDVLQG